MREPEIPSDEPRRLALLHALQILDTPAEERFDRITRSAQRLLRAPIAALSLVDARRQWFKSAQGTSIRETPRADSFCAHAILGEGTFVVADARDDARFAATAMVAGEPHVRAYAGEPLSTVHGCRLGTLCVLDVAPRAFAAEELQILRDLAAWAENELLAGARARLEADLVQERNHLRQQAMVDPATRAWSRAAALDALPRELARAQREDAPLAVAMAELDRVPEVRAAYGPRVGEAVLREAASRARAAVRSYDTVGHLGGGRFLLVIPSCGRAEAVEVAERIRRAIAGRPFTVPEGEAHLTMSVGLAACPAGIDPEAIVAAAAAALARAQQGGRDRVEAQSDF